MLVRSDSRKYVSGACLYPRFQLLNVPNPMVSVPTLLDSIMWHSQSSCDNSVYFVESFSLSQFGGIRTHIQKEKSAISSKNNIKDLKRSFLVLKT